MGNIKPDAEGVTVEIKLSELYLRPFKIPFQDGVCRSYVGNAIHYAAYELLKEKA